MTDAFNFSIPSSQVPALLSDGTFTLPWRRYFQTFGGGGSVTPADLAALTALVNTLASDVATVQGDAVMALSDASTALDAASDAFALATVGVGEDDAPPRQGNLEALIFLSIALQDA